MWCQLRSSGLQDEVVAAVNAVRYGLAGSVWTNDLTVAHRITRRIHSGILWVNCWLHRYVEMAALASPFLMAHVFYNPGTPQTPLPVDTQFYDPAMFLLSA